MKTKAELEDELGKLKQAYKTLEESRDGWRDDGFSTAAERDKLRDEVGTLKRRIEMGNEQLKAAEKQRDALAWYICQQVLHLDPKA